MHLRIFNKKDYMTQGFRNYYVYVVFPFQIPLILYVITGACSVIDAILPVDKEYEPIAACPQSEQSRAIFHEHCEVRQIILQFFICHKSYR